MTKHNAGKRRYNNGAGCSLRQFDIHKKHSCTHDTFQSTTNPEPPAGMCDRACRQRLGRIELRLCGTRLLLFAVIVLQRVTDLPASFNSVTRLGL